MSNVRIIRPTEVLSASVGSSIFELTNRVWPAASEADVRDLSQPQKEWQQRGGIHCVVMSSEITNEVVAYSFILRRDVFTSQGLLGVGALASVCVDPACRGQGFGADVARAAFSVMSELGVEVSLFQTGVLQFYEKLGARVVDNRFYNGLHPGDTSNPFWDKEQMIYPATFAWPKGDIDLNGAGY